MNQTPLRPPGGRGLGVSAAGKRASPEGDRSGGYLRPPERPEGSSGFLLLGLFLASLWVTAGCGASEGKPGGGGEARGGVRAGPSVGFGEPDQERLPPPGHAWVIFGSDTVLAEVARTPEARERGLMFRQELPKGRGMLFVFPEVAIRSFWMRNTFVPLDIAFLDEHLVVVDIQAMEPQTEDLHQSARPAMFALEVPQGWFGEKGIRVGDTARVVFGVG